MVDTNDMDFGALVTALLQDKRFLNSLSQSCAYFLKDDKVFETLKKRVAADADAEVRKTVQGKIDEAKQYVDCKIENWIGDRLEKDIDDQVRSFTDKGIVDLLCERILERLDLPKIEIVVDLKGGRSTVSWAHQYEED